jgi:adenylate kinase family enzyme
LALSYTQEYFLCAVSGKGNIPAVTGGEASTSLVVAGVVELSSHGYIGLNEKEKLTFLKEWQDDLPHLKPLYDKIVSTKRALSIPDFIVGIYNPKQINELINAVGTTLVAADYLDEFVTQARTKKSYKYVPKDQVVKKIIERVRAGFIAGEALDDDTACLTALLDCAGFTSDYFNKDEVEIVRKRLKEMQKNGAPALVREIMDLNAACAVVIMGGGW